MKMKKILALIFALLMVITIAACKDDKKSSGSKANLGELDEYTSDLAVADYDGYNFRILIRPGMVEDQYVAEETADIINDAVYRRNQIVQDMYNIEISYQESSNTNAETDALNTILAGDDAFDIIFPHTRSAFSYAVQHAVANINEIDAIHLDKPWWSKDIIDSCNIGGNLYVLDGDISLHRLSYAMGLFFNKNIFDELGLEYPYQMVKDGTWTYDEFTKLVKKGTKDLNGDGIIQPGVDRFGFATGAWASPIGILYTGGQRIFTKNANGVPILSLNTSKTVDIFEKYFDLVDSNDVYMEGVDTADPNIFPDGRAMFYDGSLYRAKTYRGMEDNFGIIPYPKFTATDNYTSFVNGRAHLMVIPTTVSDFERTGNIIEALCAIGSREVVPAFYEVSLKTKFARDAESEEMIDIIKDSIVYDLGYMLGDTFGSIGHDLAVSQSHDFTSTYAANASAANIKLKEFNKAYGDIR